MIHKLYWAGVTDADAAVTWICPADTEIVAVKWVYSNTAPTDGSMTRYELSFSATSQFTTNDTVNVIDEFAAASNELTTSGGLDNAKNLLHMIPGGVRVEAGEKVYLHVKSTGISSQHLNLLLYTSAGATNKSSFRRRQ